MLSCGHGRHRVLCSLGPCGLLCAEKALLLDRLALDLLPNVLLKAISSTFLNLAVDYALGKLTERDYSWQSGVIDLRQDKGLFPEVVKEVEFGKLRILLHNEDIENVDAALLIDRVCLQSVDVVDAVKRKVVLAHSVKILTCIVVWVVLDLNVACVATATATRRPTHVRALR